MVARHALTPKAWTTELANPEVCRILDSPVIILLACALGGVLYGWMGLQWDKIFLKYNVLEFTRSLDQSGVFMFM